MGIIIHQNIPLTLHYWKHVTKEFKITLYDKVLLTFDVDMSFEHVRDAVDDSLKDHFKYRCHKIHLYYLSLAIGWKRLSTWREISHNRNGKAYVHTSNQKSLSNAMQEIKRIGR